MEDQRRKLDGFGTCSENQQHLPHEVSGYASAVTGGRNSLPHHTFMPGQTATVRGTELFVAVPAPVLPQPGEEATQTLHALLVPNHQQRRSAFGTDRKSVGEG